MQQTTKILVVDDEEDMASLVRMKFRKEIRSGELDFSFAEDGLDALERLAVDPEIELVLTDINMPRMDGLALLDRLADQDRLLKAVVVSAYGDMENIRAAMNRGAFDFLTKPIELEDLEITINKSRATIAQQKRELLVRDLFGRYVSNEVVTALLARPEAVRLGGEKRKVTLLMSDLRGFSTLSEGQPPERVVEVLNIYLGRMADVITAFGGTINEFIGDAILVLFGAPIQREDDAQRAVACALEMQLAMGDVNAQMARLGLPPLEMGIGLNTGEVVVGNIGSARRVKYGVVGSHVNLTSRIESYTVGGQILISEHTLDDAGTAVQIGEEMEVTVKGFSRPVRIYAVDAIGAPYDLVLPAQVEHLAVLAQPLPVRFSVLDGKHMTGAMHEGTLVRLSTLGAVLRTPHPLVRMDNLKMLFPVPDAPAQVLGDLYAKVTDTAAYGGGLKLRFTAVPEDVAAAVRQLIAR
jgi:adenylate cyclase